MKLRFTISNVLISLLCVYIGSCQSISSNRKVSEIAEVGSPYETVNVVPQFADDNTHFLLYWAIWRGLTEQEKSILNGNEGFILSLRDISWTVNDCQSDSLIHADGEKVWYLDELKWDAQGSVVPIKEAPRNGYRYFNLLNINSQHLRGAGAFKGPKKQKGEKMEDWDKRRHRAYLEWLKKSWVKNTKGSIFLRAEHKLFSKQVSMNQDPWIDPKDYPKLTGDLLDKITKYSPSRWPVNFDERAHKPHLFNEPKAWQDPRSISNHHFRAQLIWNWCNPDEPVVTELRVAKGELPPPGPNRPGRPSSGQTKIKVTEVDWPY